MAQRRDENQLAQLGELFDRMFAGLKRKPKPEVKKKHVPNPDGFDVVTPQP